MISYHLVIQTLSPVLHLLILYSQVVGPLDILFLSPNWSLTLSHLYLVTSPGVQLGHTGAKE